MSRCSTSTGGPLAAAGQMNFRARDFDRSLSPRRHAAPLPFPPVSCAAPRPSCQLGETVNGRRSPMQVRACEGAAAACGPILSSTDREASARAGAQGIQPNLTEARKWSRARPRARCRRGRGAFGEVGWGWAPPVIPEFALPARSSGRQRISGTQERAPSLLGWFEVGGDVSVSFQDVDDLERASDVTKEDHVISVGHTSEVGE